MFYVDETLVEGCGCEEKPNAPRVTMLQKLEAENIGVWCRRDASFFAKPILRERATSHPRSSPAGPTRFVSVRVGSVPKEGIWCM